MIRIPGFAVSNYYNKVKPALPEKGIDSEEVDNRATKDEATLALSPLGKIPFIETGHGPLCESQVNIESARDGAAPLRARMKTEHVLLVQSQARV